MLFSMSVLVSLLDDLVTISNEVAVKNFSLLSFIGELVLMR